MTLALQRLLIRLRSAVWKSRRPGTLTQDRVRELSRELQSEKDSLEGLTASLEKEFLHLGSLLRKITALTGDVRSRSTEIADAAAGRAEDAAIQFAFQLLKKAEDLVRASREQYDSVFQVFEKMHLELRRVARERNALMRTLSPLETTNTQFRIEACSFDESIRAQFFGLADAIAGIVRDVQSAVGQRFEELDRTGQATGELVAQLTVSAAEQRTTTERMLAETRSHLSSLNDALIASERAAQSMGHLGETIAGGVGRAIVALQCQDMARQKFQHICAAIEEMIVHLPSEFGGGFSDMAEADCRHFLADAGRVQLGQLRAVFEQLTEAARQVDAGLGEVETEAKSLAGHAVRSGNAALDGRVIQSAIESIHAVLSVIENAVRSITGVVELVLKLKSTFSDCTTEILGLALRLRMVALNAQIFAAHVDQGASLEVVARNTRMIADESMRQLDEISFRVNELVSAVAELEQRLLDYSEVATIEQKLLTSEAGESEKKLRNLDQNLRASIAAIGPIEADLAKTIQTLLQSIDFPGAVAEAQARSTTLFEQVASLHSDKESKAHHKVQDLERNYTMAHERTVHESAVKTNGQTTIETNRAVVEGGAMVQKISDDDSPVPAPAAASSCTSAVQVDEEKLADNVELF